MSLSQLPNECINKIFSFLDKKSLYICLFVNRHWCRLIIPEIWRDPFVVYERSHNSAILVNTLFQCFNEDDLSDLNSRAIKVPKNQPSPLFEYGKFVRTISQYKLELVVIGWYMKFSLYFDNSIYETLINVIYRMIMRQGTNLQSLSLSSNDSSNHYLPDLSILRQGLTWLRDLKIDLSIIPKEHQTSSWFQVLNQFREYLDELPTICHKIDRFKLIIRGSIDEYIPIEIFIDFIKSQPIKKLLVRAEEADAGKIINSLEFKSDTLTRLNFSHIDFKNINISSLQNCTKLKGLVFKACIGFKDKHSKEISNVKFQLKTLEFQNSFDNTDSNALAGIIGALGNKELFQLTLGCKITSEIVKAVKYTCSNIDSLNLTMIQQDFNIIIPLIQELPLKILDIDVRTSVEIGSQFARILIDNLTSSVEKFHMGFKCGMDSFIPNHFVCVVC